MYGSMYRDPGMGIHGGAFLRTTYLHLDGGVLAVGICMEACIDTLVWAYTRAFLRTTYVRLERGVLAAGIYMEACMETLAWAYAEGHF